MPTTLQKGTMKTTHLTRKVTIYLTEEMYTSLKELCLAEYGCTVQTLIRYRLMQDLEGKGKLFEAAPEPKNDQKVADTKWTHLGSRW